MGNTWSQFKGQRNEKNRKKPYRVISESERDVITKNKAQMEEQINALNEKVNMEKAAWVSARNSSLPLGEKIARISLALESAKVIDTGEPAVNGLVKNRSWHHCPTCSKRIYLKQLDKSRPLDTCQ
ncbi:uncharacterized protein [Acropora muricata]|uniref:uncharacterized protein LOC114970301 n=1 Tax=Acropora millepora TaxID=45264 RepID=UPI0010FCA788|nr:uncharacterized protein LOC114970301 [Acropora millepora]